MRAFPGSASRIHGYLAHHRRLEYISLEASLRSFTGTGQQREVLVLPPSDWIEFCQSLVSVVFFPKRCFLPNLINDGANSLDDQFWLLEVNKMSTLFSDDVRTVW